MKKALKPRLYKKAPVKFLLQQAARLSSIANWSLLFGAIFLILSNPFAVYDALSKLPRDWQQAREMLSSVPAFVQDFPSEIEKTSFAVFDQVQVALHATTISADQEAGQSAVLAAETVDYEQLPFFIEIPSLNVYEKVQSNTNPNDAVEYQAALAEGVAHARGSAFPPEGRLVYIFGHSTDGLWNVEAYNAVFYQIKDLQIGELVILHFGEEKFTYQVTKQDIVKSSEIDFVNDARERNILLLQTCWPPGTSWQRLFVTAEPIL
jgi:LPXTG-site transpeptidase (sortase) family protein